MTHTHTFLFHGHSFDLGQSLSVSRSHLTANFNEIIFASKWSSKILAICENVAKRKKFSFYCVAEEVFVSVFFFEEWNWNSIEILCAYTFSVMFKSDTPKWQSLEILLQHTFFSISMTFNAWDEGKKVKNKLFHLSNITREYFAMSSAFTIIFYETFLNSLISCCFVFLFFYNFIFL